MSWNPRYAILIVISTIITYAGSLIIEKSRWKKLVLASVVLSNLAILCYFKYSNFLLGTILRLANLFGGSVKIPYVDVVLPVGISFYTFQALSYSIDVSRGTVKAERNFFKYALFVSFFPQLVAGPIERSKTLLAQINEKHKLKYESVREGLMIMLWGFILKLIIADRIAIVVDTVIANPEEYNYVCLCFMMVLFAFQIYCDFAGYSTIALGAAKVMGFTLTDNFNAPYYSKSVKEFWRRWHISLNSWFVDYLYIPLGGNRVGKIRKYFNTMMVFLVSGLWHGADWHFVVWGGLNGIYQVLGELLTPIREKFTRILKIKEKSLLVLFLKWLVTFILVDIAWLFFRAPGGSVALVVLNRITSLQGSFCFASDIESMGLDLFNIIIVVCGIILIMISDAFKYKKIVVREWICSLSLPLRFIILFLGVMAIVFLGVYGEGYDETAFLYFQF